MRSSLASIVAGAVLVPLGCLETVTPPLFEPRLVFTDLWSGGQLSVTATAFIPPATLPTILLGADTLPVARLDDTTVSARLPGLTGSFDLRVAQGRSSSVLGPVTLHGFADARALSGLWGVLTALGGGTPLVFGSGTRSVVLADLRYGTLLDYADSLHSPLCDWGPGATFLPTRLVLEQLDTLSPVLACKVSTWTLTPSSAQRVDTGPSWTGGRIVAEIAPARWLFSKKHDFDLVECDSTGCHATVLGSCGQLDGVTISPRGDRVAPDMYWDCGQRVPILDAPSASIAYRVPLLAWSEGATYSSDGDTLFMAGADSSGRGWFLALRASDGRVLDSTRLEVSPGDVAFDPLGRWIYVSGTTATFTPTDTTVAITVGAQLEVLDRATRVPVTILTTVELPVGCDGGCGYWNKQRLVLDVPDRRVYVVSTDIYIVPEVPPLNPTALVFRFETPP
ncbi:MAG: YncE family protein [Gemmatimonadota bacterium]